MKKTATTQTTCRASGTSFKAISVGPKQAKEGRARTLSTRDPPKKGA